MTLGERLGPLQIMGCGLVLAGVAVATVLGTRAGPFGVTQAGSAGPSPDGGARVAGRIL